MRRACKYLLGQPAELIKSESEKEKIMLTNKQIAFKKELIKKLHTLKTTRGISEDQYRAALGSFGVESSKDLSIKELIAIIDRFNGINPEDDLWRKRCMAAIGAWLRITHKVESRDYIHAIACQATGYVEFNKIPKSHLQSLYYEFIRKVKVIEGVDLVISEKIKYQVSNN